MTSGIFFSAPISSITVLPNRQRKSIDPAADDALRSSIASLGLIHPIVLDDQDILIAGFRRLSRCKELGWTSIPAQRLGDAPADVQLEIYRQWVENHENAIRRDLTWQELNDYTTKMVELQRQISPEATQAVIGQSINLSTAAVGQHLLVKEYRDKRPEVFDKPDMTLNKAVREARRLKEREAADAWNAHDKTAEPCASPIIQADFNEWAPSYTGPKFNIIHCDFPYGINSQTSAANPSGYDDSPEVYFTLLKTLALHLDRFCAPSAHMIFWCSANIEIASNTFQLLKLLYDFTFDEVPLIWVKSDGKGIAPDPQRRFRRVYELAFFGWRGDRRHCLLKDNAFAAPSSGESHPHEKPVVVLEHFFAGLIDSASRLLDPTCGSGSAIRTALALGASDAVGLERSPLYCDEARRALEIFQRRHGKPTAALQDDIRS